MLSTIAVAKQHTELSIKNDAMAVTNRLASYSNPELIKSPTRCPRFATAATLKCGPWSRAATRILLRGGLKLKIFVTSF